MLSKIIIIFFYFILAFEEKCKTASQLAAIETATMIYSNFLKQFFYSASRFLIVYLQYRLYLISGLSRYIWNFFIENIWQYVNEISNRDISDIFPKY